MLVSRAIRASMLPLLVAISTACAPQAGMLVGSWSSKPATLHLEREDRLVAVDAGTAQVRFELPHTIAAPGGERLFRVSHETEGTRIEALRGEDGSLVASYTVPDVQEALVASPRGRLVALASSESVAGPWLAPGRQWTTLTIADVEQGRHRVYPMLGNYVPEAFSLRDDRLFVVEYLPANEPDRYRIRQLDLSTGAVLPVGQRNDKSPPAIQEAGPVEEEMRGRSRMHVMAPDHSRLYTLYVHDGDHLHRRDALALGGTGRPDPNVHAFVHVLSLNDGWAYCLDLPAQFGLGPADKLAVTVSPDGKRLSIADLSAAHIAVADTEQLRIVETVPIVVPDGDQEGSPLALRATRDGLLIVATGSALTVLDRRGTVRSQVRLNEPALAMELAADGHRIFILGSTGVTIFDPS
jgi:hypothetical protein